MGEFKGEVYIASAVAEGRGYIGIENRAALRDPGIRALIVVYADLHGERVINRLPLTFEEEAAGVLITDRKGRSWRALGFTSGDARSPRLEPWHDAPAGASPRGGSEGW